MATSTAPLPTNTLAGATQGLINHSFFAIRALVLANNVSIVVQELNKEHRLFAPLAEFFKRTEIGDACIKAAIVLCGPYGLSTFVNDILNFENYTELTRSSLEVLEMGGYFLSYVADNISTFSAYAPTIALIAECSEFIGEGFKLYDAICEVWANNCVNAQSPEEQEIVNTRAKIAGLKISKSVIKIFSLLALYNAYSLLLSASLSLASVSLSLGVDFYKQYSAEGHHNTVQIARMRQETAARVANFIVVEHHCIS